jgi:hypothetical protein
MSREVAGSADPVKAMSVISTAAVRMHPDQRYGGRSPLYWWLLTSLTTQLATPGHSPAPDSRPTAAGQLTRGEHDGRVR